ncbi:hypothetical protein B0H67DRAFT_686051 [Lasiosphaeris hirsuta]|uniref:Uncharacterized protein n=1 Tax=Lasiosphaeris hirsuta TaxID=260670 RepID=A0AA40A203_9PEZI|nr:hypothetical protein B0H67DRAFT_686051 [Lasiosphaeris hirsuta]
MEIVGLVAAAISINKTVRSTARLARRLYEIAREAPRVEKQLHRTAIQLSSFSTTASAAWASIERNCPKEPEPKSPVLRYIIANRLPAELDYESYHLRGQIRDLRDRISTLHSKFELVTSWRWNKMQPDIDMLFTPMESLKTSLTLILNIIILETITVQKAQNNGRPSPEQERETALLKKVIEEQIEIIRQLREEHRVAPIILDDVYNSPGAPAVDPQLTLCHLARSMVDMEEVPSSPPETFTFSRPRRRPLSYISSSGSESPRRPRRDTVSPLTPPESPTVPSASTVPPPPHRLPRQRGSYRPPSPFVASPREDSSEGEIEVRNRGISPSQPETNGHAPGESSDREIEVEHQSIPPQPQTVEDPPDDSSDEEIEVERHAQPPRPRVIVRPPSPPAGIIKPRTPPASEPTDSQTELEARPKKAAPTPPSTSTSTPPAGAPHAEVLKRHVSFEAEEDEEVEKQDAVVSSYLRLGSSRERVRVVAHIDRVLKYNLISRTYANRLRLDIERHAGKAVRAHGGGVVQTIGTARLPWYSTDRSSVTVDCYVCEDEDLEHSLTFGRSFGRLWETR